MSKVVAVIPAKGSSERLVSKNIKSLYDRPLLIHAVQKLLACKQIDEVYVDTESDEIAALVEGLCKVMKRDPKLASNATDGNRLLLNEVEHIKGDIYVQYLCTSPFLELATIEKCIDAVKSSEYDSATTVRKEKVYSWDSQSQQASYDINNIPNSKDLPESWFETMGLYVIRRETALNLNRRVGNKPFLCGISKKEAIDIDYPEDFELAELIVAAARKKENEYFNRLRRYVNSSQLSDVMQSLGLKDRTLSRMQSNLEQSLCGRAKTLEVAPVSESKWDIYKSVDVYKYLSANDVLVVENKLPEYAFFGEINANLAIRSGASGAIIGGLTRDSQKVKNLDFPVYSYGYTPLDIKDAGGVKSINRKVNIQGVDIYPDDIIFADTDGIVVIPNAMAETVLRETIQLLGKEELIIKDIRDDINPDDLLKQHGKF